MTSEEIVDDAVTRLCKLDSCTISDAFDQLGFSGVVTGVPRRSGSRCIAGIAATLKLHRGPPPAGSVRHLGTTVIEESSSDHIIVVEQRTGIEAGCWGGLLSLGAKVNGITGLIADGPVRDIDEAIACDFPIFSTALTAITARGRISEAGTNVPVTVWGVTVNPGDYVIADQSAIVFISADNIEPVLDQAESIAAGEAEMVKQVRAGAPVSEVMSEKYENMLKPRG